MRTITLEEHFATPRFLDGPGRDLKEQAEKFNNARALKLIPQLCDLGDKRIAEMDAAGIDMQIVSLTAPGVEQLEAAEGIALAAETNDFVADAIKRHPARFGGFAALPTASPDKAAQELERRVRGQKFAGAIMNGHNRARYLDDRFFWPILESAEQLGAPIYLHPTRPPQPVIDASFSGFSPPRMRRMTWTAVSMCQPQPGPENISLTSGRVRPLSQLADRHRPSRRRTSRYA